MMDDFKHIKIMNSLLIASLSVSCLLSSVSTLKKLIDMVFFLPQPLDFLYLYVCVYPPLCVYQFSRQLVVVPALNFGLDIGNSSVPALDQDEKKKRKENANFRKNFSVPALILMIME